MKKTLTSLAFILLSSQAFAADCPKPNEYAASAFKVIEKGQDLEVYLSKYTVARSAVNESCEDMYMVALRTRNEQARYDLDKIGYGPKTAEEVNATKAAGVSYYMQALKHSPISVIKDLHARGGEYYYALNYAASSNSMDVIEWVMAEKKQTVDQAFTYAVYSNSQAVVEQLIRRGAIVSSTHVHEAVRRVGRNPLDFAILEVLILSGGVVNEDVMTDAVKLTTPGVVDYLRRTGGKITETTMRQAAKLGKVDMVKYHIGQGFNINHKDEQGVTLLMEAAKSPDEKTASYLIQQGADFKAVDHDGNNLYAYAEAKETFQLLKSKGLDINQRNKSGYTALHLAISKMDGKAVSLNLKTGANANLQSLSGDYPIHMAFNVNSRNYCEDPYAVVAALLDAGVNVDQRDNDGFTPLLRAAALYGCSGSEYRDTPSSSAMALKLIRLLVYKGADIHAVVKFQGKKKRNAYDIYTSRYGSNEQIEQLLKVN